MTGPDIVKKLRAQLDRNGYKDVEIKLIGDVPWALMNSDNDAGRAMKRAYEIMGIPHGQLRADFGIGGGAAAGGYWPAYLFGNGEVGERVSPFKGVPISTKPLAWPVTGRWRASMPSSLRVVMMRVATSMETGQLPLPRLHWNL